MEDSDWIKDRVNGVRHWSEPNIAMVALIPTSEQGTKDLHSPP
jgi:hypothetical protein